MIDSTLDMLVPLRLPASSSELRRTPRAPVLLSPDELRQVKEAVASRNDLTVDLERLSITHPDGLRIEFPFDPHSQETLMQGLDDVARTERREAEISAFEASYRPRFDLAEIS